MTDTKAVHLIVTGMTCQGCVNAVTKVIKRVDPSANVTIDLPTGKVDAVTSASADALAKAVSAGGYQAVAA